MQLVYAPRAGGLGPEEAKAPRDPCDGGPGVRKNHPPGAHPQQQAQLEDSGRRQRLYGSEHRQPDSSAEQQEGRCGGANQWLPLLLDLWLDRQGRGHVTKGWKSGRG